MFTDVFIRRPILATVCSIVIMLAGAIAIPTLPIGRYPELAPPTVTVTAFYTGANAQAVESARDHAARVGHQRRRGHDLHDLVEHEQRVLQHHGHVRGRPQSRPRGGRRAEPRQSGAGPDAGGGADQRHHRHEEHGGISRRRSGSFLPTTGTTRCSSATTWTGTSATRSSACPASATSSSSASASSPCGCGWIPTGWPDAA